MIVRLIAIGTMRQRHLATGVQLYMERLRHYGRFELVEIEDRRVAARRPEEQQVKEAEAVLAQTPAGFSLTLLDERGQRCSSAAFSRYIEEQGVSGRRGLCLAIGGPWGWNEALRQRADRLLSLSDMTFTHEMARLFLVEQLYRAMTIIRGEPYHHE